MLVCFNAAHKSRIRQRLEKWRVATALQIAVRNCHFGDAVALFHELNEIEHLSLQVLR